MRGQKLYRIKLHGKTEVDVAVGCVPFQGNSGALSVSLHKKWAIFRLFPDLKLAIEPILRFGVRTHC